MIATFKKLVEEQKQSLVETYRYLHIHPELSFQEHETSLFIQSELKKMEISFQSGIGGYGILGIIEGNDPERKIIALRADMDAPVFGKIFFIFCKSHKKSNICIIFCNFGCPNLQKLCFYEKKRINQVVSVFK
jgi:hypothetical protein